jgi:UTP--glucose-1-phosphate uridylyltransferase
VRPVHIRKAVIPAAGLGTRFLPATKAVPKEMLPVVDKPGIQWVVEEAVAAGLADVLIVTGRSKQAIEDHFDRAPELEAALARAGKDELLAEVTTSTTLAAVHFVRQGEALGLGHAVGLARHHVGDEPFGVLLPDDLMAPGSDVLARMLAATERTGAPVIALKRCDPLEITHYGAVAIEGPPDSEGLVRIIGMVEKPAAHEAPSNLGIIGRYVLTSDVFADIDALTPGAGGELQLTDALLRQAERGPFYGLVLDGGRYDAGNKLDWLRATVEFALVHPELGPGFRDTLRAIATRHGLS